MEWLLHNSTRANVVYFSTAISFERFTNHGGKHTHDEERVHDELLDVKKKKKMGFPLRIISLQSNES